MGSSLPLTHLKLLLPRSIYLLTLQSMTVFFLALSMMDALIFRLSNPLKPNFLLKCIHTELIKALYHY
jgi:hypothetical protein